MGSIVIRPLEPADWPQVESIYRQGIATGDATFESTPPDWLTFDREKLTDLRLVAAAATPPTATSDTTATAAAAPATATGGTDGAILGWAAASRVSARDVYRGVIEHSVYVAENARGRGIGRALLEALIDAADSAGYWTIQSSIFPENTASLALHTEAGFRTVGTRHAIARMPHGPLAGTWRDTILLERRSPHR